MGYPIATTDRLACAKSHGKQYKVAARCTARKPYILTLTEGQLAGAAFATCDLQGKTHHLREAQIAERERNGKRGLV